MFGYVTIDPSALTPEARERYQAYYCGLCRVLKRRFGNIGRLTLSNDMTFLYMLLSSLYEPEEAAKIFAQLCGYTLLDQNGRVITGRMPGREEQK